MDDPRAQRTLVKSPPELWAEISDAGALAGHLGAFGDIRITRLEPENTVAWEGTRARGTVELEPAGWGTRVTLTAELAPEAVTGAEPVAASAPDLPEPEPYATAPDVPEPAAASAQGDDPAPAGAERDEEVPAPRRWRFLARLLGRRRDAAPEAVAERHEHDAAAPAHADEPAAGPAPAADPDPPAERHGPSPTQHHAATAEPAECSPTPPAPLSAGRAEEILTGVLDDLGAARHRPFSRG